MAIYLGNMSIKEIESRAGVQFPQELSDYMQNKHQDSADNVAKGKWHCFDIPFVLVCGDRQTAEDIYKYLSPMSKNFSQPLQIALSN